MPIWPAIPGTKISRVHRSQVGNAFETIATPSKQELGGLRALVERDLTDAALGGLSADRRFATAYNATLQTAKMLIACADRFLDYFETSRRKRNVIDYG